MGVKVPAEEKAWQKTEVWRTQTEQWAFYLITGRTNRRYFSSSAQSILTARRHSSPRGGKQQVPVTSLCSTRALAMATSTLHLTACLTMHNSDLLSYVTWKWFLMASLQICQAAHAFVAFLLRRESSSQLVSSHHGVNPHVTSSQHYLISLSWCLLQQSFRLRQWERKRVQQQTRPNVLHGWQFLRGSQHRCGSREFTKASCSTEMLWADPHQYQTHTTKKEGSGLPKT